MRIARFLSGGNIHFGQLQGEGSALELQGNIFANSTLTKRELKIDKLLAPLVPTDILCIGLNYRQHAIESKATLPQKPLLFIKAGNTLNHPGEAILIPRLSKDIDYECELAVVIGKSAKNVSRDNAMEYVLGYTGANDVSSRDWQHNKALGGGQFARGKSFDGFCPLGPCIVTKDEIPNPNALRIKTILNGEIMQDSSTADMIFDVPALIESLSSTMTLRPGTVILTGTPHGVGAGRTPPVYLKSGDTVVVDLEKVGRLENPVVNES